MKIIIPLLLSVIYISCGAKSIKGHIFDETGAGAQFVNVVLYSDSIFVDGAITDGEGVFFFDDVEDKVNLLKIFLLGYEEMFLPVNAGDQTINASLVPSANNLKEVVVQAKLPFTRVKGNAMVINVQNSVLADAGSANDVLKNVPMIQGSNGSYSVFGRGAATIYINGREIRNPSEVNQLASSDIKEIQVITNPGARYSASANAIIKIVTIKPVGEGFSLSAFTDNFVNKGFNTSDQFDLKYRTGGFEVFGVVDLKQVKKYHNEDNILTVSKETDFVTKSALSWPMVSTELISKIGFNYQFNKNHSIGSYYQNDYQKGHRFGEYLNNSSNGDALTESSVTDAKTWVKMHPGHEANIYYNGIVGKFTFDANVDYLRKKERETSILNEICEFSEDRTVDTRNISDNKLFAEKAIVSYSVLNGSVLVGEEYTDSRSANDFRNAEGILESESTEVRERNIGAFTEVSQSFASLSLSAGIRYEHVKSEYFLNKVLVKDQSRTYDNFFPSLSVNYSFGRGIGVSLAYSNRTERPSYSLLSGNYIYVNSTSYVRGNPNLKPTQRQVLSLQASWRMLSLSAQYVHAKDEILQIYEQYKGNDHISVFTPINMPRHRSFVMSVNASPAFGIYHPSLSLGLQKQWFDVNYKGGAINMGKPCFTIQLNNILSLPKGWSIGGWVWWRSRGDWINWKYTRTMSSVDLRITKKLLNNALTIYVGANDIFNGQIFHGSMYYGNVVTHSNVNNYGRNVEFAIRYRLNSSKNRYKGSGAGQSEKNRF